MTNLPDISQLTAADLQPHPSAEIFPAMDDDTFAALIADIKANGLREAIVVDQHNRIVDGLNRYRACRDVGIEPVIERRTFTETEAIEFCISRNLHRRHLDAAQRAAIAADLASLKQGGKQPANLPVASSQTKAAKLMGVSERAVRSAVKVKEHCPELHALVKAGASSVHLAEQACALPKEQQNSVVTMIAKGDVKAAKATLKTARTNAASTKPTKSDRPGVYADLFAALDALPHNLSNHPLLTHHASELIALLTEAIKQIEHASKSDTSQTRSK